MRQRLLAVFLPGLLLGACADNAPPLHAAGTPDAAQDGAPAPGTETAGHDADDPDADAPDGDVRDGDVIVSTNEPFWQARVEGDTIVLVGAGVPERKLTGAKAAMTAGGRRIAARDGAGEVVVTVRKQHCEDDMSGARFPLTGLLVIDGGAAIRGCAYPASMPRPRPPEE